MCNELCESAKKYVEDKLAEQALNERRVKDEYDKLHDELINYKRVIVKLINCLEKVNNKMLFSHQILQEAKTILDEPTDF